MRPCATCSLAIIGPGPVALYGHKIKDQKSYGFAAKYQNRLYNIKKKGGGYCCKIQTLHLSLSARTYNYMSVIKETKLS